MCFFFFKQKTAYEMRISDWSSDVCSSDLPEAENQADRIKLMNKPAFCILLTAFLASAASVAANRRGEVEYAVGSGGMVPVSLAGEIGRASCRARVCQYV